MLFLNSPFSSLNIMDLMPASLRMTFSGQQIHKVPINELTSDYGSNFTHYLLCNDIYVKNNKIYHPKLNGLNETFYNISCYMPSVVEISETYQKELFGYNKSWGDDRSIFGLTKNPGLDEYDINNTNTLAYKNQVLIGGILNYFTNEYFNPGEYFNNFLYNWIENGYFNRKYSLKSNQTNFDMKNTHFNLHNPYKIKNQTGSIISNGTLFTIKANKGKILSKDASEFIEGHQIRSNNGFLNINFSSQADQGLFEVAIFNCSPHNVILSYSVNFTYVPDYTNPQLILNSEMNNSIVITPPLINACVFDKNLDAIWYKVDGFARKEYMENNTAEYLNETYWSNLEETRFFVRFFANDTHGNINDSLFLTYIRDSKAPRLIINEPSNKTWNSVEPSLNITVLDPYFDTLWYEVSTDFTKFHFSNKSSTDLDPDVWDQLDQGEFYLYLYANDSAGNTNDSYQFKLFKDTLPPQIFINSPFNNTHFNNRPEINVTVIDPNFEQLYYEINGKNISLANSSNHLLEDSIWQSLSNGNFSLNFYANDTFGHINSLCYLKLIKDTHAPNISSIFKPINNTIINKAPELHVSVEDLSLNSVWYKVSNFTEKVFIMNNTLEQFDLNLWSQLDDGMMNITFFANDTLGYSISSQSIYLFKDTQVPEIIIHSPNKNDEFMDCVPQYNLSVYDKNLNKTWYTLNSDQNLIFFTNLTGNINKTAWNSLREGLVNITFFANDSIGNIGQKSVHIYKNTNETVEEGDEEEQKVIKDDSNDIKGISFQFSFIIYILISISLFVTITYKRMKKP